MDVQDLTVKLYHPITVLEAQSFHCMDTHTHHPSSNTMQNALISLLETRAMSCPHQITHVPLAAAEIHSLLRSVQLRMVSRLKVPCI